MPDSFANFATSTIKGGAAGDGTQLGISDTTLRVQTADASLFPSSFPFSVLLGTWSGGSGAHELVQCTARATNVLTIVRGQESTSAAAWPVGTPVEAVCTAANLDNKVSADGDTMTALLTVSRSLAGSIKEYYRMQAGDGIIYGFCENSDQTWTLRDITNGKNLLTIAPNTGTATFTGSILVAQSATAPSIGNNGTISTASLGSSRVTTAGAVTGIILQAGTAAGQTVIVVNESANTLTMAASGTSNVADGTSCVIAANRAMWFVWDSGTSRWHHS